MLAKLLLALTFAQMLVIYSKNLLRHFTLFLNCCTNSHEGEMEEKHFSKKAGWDWEGTSGLFR